MSLTFAAGDAGKVREAAAAYRTLGAEIDTLVKDLRSSVGDWRAQNLWTGEASDRAAQAWTTYLDQLTQRAAGYTAFAGELDKIASSIDSAVHRARNVLIASSVTFVLAAGFAIFTAGASEGAEAVEVAAAAAEIAEIEVTLGEAITAGFTTALSQTLIRSAIGIGTSLAIPAAGTQLHHLVTGKPWTVQDLDGILIGGSLGLVVGGAAAVAQVGRAGWSTAAQVIYGTTTGAGVGGVSSVIGQASLSDGRKINWKIVGYSAGLGGLLGGATARAGVAIGDRFKPPTQVTPNQEGAAIEMVELGADGRPIGDPAVVNIDAVADSSTGRTSLVLSNSDGSSVLSEEGLASLSDAELPALQASQNRLVTAASFTSSSTTAHDLQSTIGSVDPVVEVTDLPGGFTVHTNPLFEETVEETRALGAALRQQLAELEAVDAGAAEHLATTAADPLSPASADLGGGLHRVPADLQHPLSPAAADAGDTAWTALTRHNELAEEIDRTAIEYQQNLHQIEIGIAAAETPPGEPLDILTIPGADPAIETEIARAESIADSVGPLQLPGQDGTPATDAAHLGLDTADVAPQPRESATARIVATSSVGAALGAAGAGLTGPGVLPRLEDPPEGNPLPYVPLPPPPVGSFETA